LVVVAGFAFDINSTLSTSREHIKMEQHLLIIKNEGTTPEYSATMPRGPGAALPGSTSISRYTPRTSYWLAAHLAVHNRYTAEIFFC
jgi:hypothetical protein